MVLAQHRDCGRMRTARRTRSVASSVLGLVLASVFLVTAATVTTSSVFGQATTPEQAQAIETRLKALRGKVEEVRKAFPNSNFIPDAEVYAKAAEWVLRHNEFFKPDYATHALQGLDTGLARAEELLQSKGKGSWEQKPGKRIQAYQSQVDQSIQPYAIALPADHGKQPEKRWPLHLVLHGRGAAINEVNFIWTHDSKNVSADQDWIQLDVFGRTNNGYRYSGEADVFEAFQDVKRRYRIDDKRVVLHGFSMGGAGSWHLGLHYPSLWCSVGPGAGFVDFYKYQKVDKKLPFYQDSALKIYDSVEYALNAYNVPVCTYGGELDPQLAASLEMKAAADKLDVPIKVIIGPGVEHKFHPESQKEFMAWHRANEKKGQPGYPAPNSIRFVTHTLKYNKCYWLTILEMKQQYQPATVEAAYDRESGLLKVKTKNVAMLELARDLADFAEIDGTKLALSNAADGLLPGVFYEHVGDRWTVLSYDSSLNFDKNLDFRKRHNLQGPIDDAFMSPFICVNGTGKAWSQEQHDWSQWTLRRFQREFDKWLRGQVQVVTDEELTPEVMMEKNLILFGDPGSNSYLAKILPRLPIKWTRDGLIVHGEKYDPATHGVALIYPNPLNPRKYVVINSGHTFHEAEFKASNAQLYPRLGDIAVLKFEKSSQGDYKETTLWADFFNLEWKLPSGLAPQADTKPDAAK